MDFKVNFKYWHDEVSYKQFDLLHRYRSQPPDLDSPIAITKRNLTKYKYDDLMDQVSKDLILRQYHDQSNQSNPISFILERVHLTSTMCWWGATRRGRVLQSIVPQRLTPSIPVQCITSLEVNNLKIIRDAFIPGLLWATPPAPTRNCH